MGKKYVVEIGRLERLYKAYVNGNGKPNITWLSPEVDLTPYTEPDLEQVRKEAYENGYENGFVAGHLKAEKSGQSFYEDGYQCGLNDAWECMKKITHIVTDQGTMIDMFGCRTFGALLEQYTPGECIEKIQQYKQEKEEIQVGDEVNALFGKAIVVNVDSVAEKIWFLYADGHVGFDFFKNAPTKTGRHFPEIAEVLAKMKETDNG